MTDDLAGYSEILAQDEYHLEFVDEMISFTNMDNIKNNLAGVTMFSLPSESILFVFTSATQGSLSTPWFGEPFSLKFKNNVLYKYILDFPANLSTSAVNGSIVLDLMVDTMEFSREIEELRIFPSMGQQEFFSNISKLTITRQYMITKNFQYGRRLEIHFLREVDSFNLGLWENKRMTGFSLNWRIQDQNNKSIFVPPTPEYKTQNQNLIRFFEYLSYSKQYRNTSFEEIWNHVKETKRKSIEYERYTNDQSVPCDGVVVNSGTQDYYVNTLRTGRKLTQEMPDDLLSNFTDEDYIEGYRMYLYLIACPSKEQIDTSYAWVEFYRDLFDKNKRHQARTIVQTITNNMNVKIRNGQAHNLIEQALLKKLDEEHLHSNMEEISLPYSDQSYATRNNRG